MDYLKLSLAVDLRFLPTLLGLRLLSEPEYGREFRRTQLSTMFSDTFLWQPVTPIAKVDNKEEASSSSATISKDRKEDTGINKDTGNRSHEISQGGFAIASPLPNLQQSPGLMKGLHSIIKICLRKKTMGRCGYEMATLLTALHFLRGLSERALGVLPLNEEDEKSFQSGNIRSDIDWRCVAEHTAKLCKLPEDHRRQWDALMCWCFGSLGQKERNLDLNANDDDAVPVLSKWIIQPSAEFQFFLNNRGVHTAVLQAEIVGVGQISQQEKLKVMLGGKASLDGVTRETLNVVGFDSETLEVNCLLPPMGLDRSTMSLQEATTEAIALCDISQSDRGPIMLSSGPQILRFTQLKKFTAPPPVRLAATNWITAALEAVAGASAFSQTHGLTVLTATENLADYQFSFGLLHPAPSKSTKPTVDLIFPQGRLSSRKVDISISKPTASISLGLCCPVTEIWHRLRVTPESTPASAAGTGAASGRYKISLSMNKSFIWPGDDSLITEKIKVEDLPVAALSHVGEQMGHMFSLAEGMQKMQMRGQVSGSVKNSVLFDVKESVQALFVQTLKIGRGSMVHELIDASKPLNTERGAASLIVIIHKIVELPDGRPLAHISCLDHEVAEALYVTDEQKLPAGRRFQSVLRSVGVPGTNKVSCVAGEVEVFRRILYRNAQRMVAPKWQKKLLEGAPEWSATYLTPLYTGRCIF